MYLVEQNLLSMLELKKKHSIYIILCLNLQKGYWENRFSLL
jgi:hypothetical protein